jgi:hypothetical protein
MASFRGQASWAKIASPSSKLTGLACIDIERKNRLLKVYYVPTTSATFLAFFLFFLTVAINRNNEANKAGGTCR